MPDISIDFTGHALYYTSARIFYHTEIEDFVSFFGQPSGQAALAGMIPDTIFKLGENRWPLPIIELLRDHPLASQYRASVMLQQLILEVFHVRRDKNIHGKNDRLNRLIVKNSDIHSHWRTVAPKIGK